MTRRLCVVVTDLVFPRVENLFGWPGVLAKTPILDVGIIEVPCEVAAVARAKRASVGVILMGAWGAGMPSRGCT